METLKQQPNRSKDKDLHPKQQIHPPISALPEESWMVELAQNEKAMLQDDTIHIRDDEDLREAECQKQTEQFMLAIRHQCSRLVEIFNQTKGSESNTIKMFKIAGSHLDFMLFRNTLKLVFSSPRTGIIDIYFSSYLETSKSNEENPYVSGERLELNFGPFDEPHWTLKNERINLNFLLRKFVSDFVLMSSIVWLNFLMLSFTLGLFIKSILTL